jgi:hypothetical protein
VILVDTSVWIEHFRPGSPFDLAEAIDFDDAVTCLPVVQEVLQGIDDQHAFLRVREAMRALPTVEAPLAAGLFEAAVDLYRSARRAGVTVRSSADCLIAACALRNSLMILHQDRDYPALARVAALEERDIRA